MRSEFEPIVSKEWIPIRVALMVGVLVGLGALLVAFTTFRGIRGRADTPKAAPTPLSIPTAVPQPKTTLTTPYLRLVTAKDAFKLEERVPIEVYLDTNGREVVEASVVVSYDSDVLEISAEDISVTEVFKAVNVQEVESGKVTFSLFITPTVGHQPVQLEKEAKIATLGFRAKSLEKQNVRVSVEFSKGDATKTSLTPFSEERVEKPENILETVEGASFDISS